MSYFHVHTSLCFNYKAQSELNTNLGKTARFYAGNKFYVPGNDYTGLALGSSVKNNINGLKFVSASDYKHYYTFPEGTYLININLFATFEASASNVLGAALKVDVNDVTIANPWFRMIDPYQSFTYSAVITGSKLKVTMYTARNIEISNNSGLSFIDFVRIV